MSYIKVKGYDYLIRDPKTNSIINTNRMEYNEYMSRKELKEHENQKIQNLEKDLDNIKCDLDEIKCLLRNLTNDSK
jgi:hypothetical protein